MLKAKGVTKFEDAADDEMHAEVEQKLDIKTGAEEERRRGRREDPHERQGLGGGGREGHGEGGET